MHPDIRIELGRQRHAELLAAGEANRIAAQATTDASASRAVQTHQPRPRRRFSLRRAGAQSVAICP
jgi:hypothetical protein